MNVREKLKQAIQQILELDDATFKSMLAYCSLPKAHDMAMRKAYLYGVSWSENSPEYVMKLNALFLDKHGRYPETEDELFGVK